MKTKTSLAGICLAGALALSGCDRVEKPKNVVSTDSFVTTAENVIIEPHYANESPNSTRMNMDGIVVKRFAYGNGLDVRRINDSIFYSKGSKEYETLRPLLTVEVEKRYQK